MLRKNSVIGALHVLVLCGLAATPTVQGQRAGIRDKPVRRGLRAQLVGCYALFLATGKRVDSDFYNASPLVRLDSAVHRAVTADSVSRRLLVGRRLLVRLDTTGRRLDPVDPRPRLGPMWWADSLSDTISVSFTTGFSGAFPLLAPSARPDTLGGYIEDHWDFNDPITRAGTKAYAIRVPCVK